MRVWGTIFLAFFYLVREYGVQHCKPGCNDLVRDMISWRLLYRGGDGGLNLCSKIPAVWFDQSMAPQIFCFNRTKRKKKTAQ